MKRRANAMFSSADIQVPPLANLRFLQESATSMMPLGRLRRIDRRLIHRSAWRNCLENRVGSRIVVPKAAKWGRRGTDRPLPAAKVARLKGLRLLSKRFRKGASGKLAYGILHVQRQRAVRSEVAVAGAQSNNRPMSWCRIKMR